MNMIREYTSFTFDQRDMLLSLRIWFGFVRAAVACSVPERTPSFERVGRIIQLSPRSHPFF